MGRKESNAAVDAAVTKVLTLPDAPLTSAEDKIKKPRATVKEKRLLDEIAVEIFKLNQGIVSMLKRSTRDAVKIGNHLNRVKPLFESINVGTSFKAWQREKCGLSEGTVHNYTKLAEGAAKDPSVLELGLNDAYIKLGIKKKHMKKPTIGAQLEANSPVPSGPVKIDQMLGAHEVFKEKGMYIVELEADWEKELSKIMADISALGNLLVDGGLLIRVLPSNPQFDELETLVAEEAPAAAH